jgi:hypothetical protein
VELDMGTMGDEGLEVEQYAVCPGPSGIFTMHAVSRYCMDLGLSVFGVVEDEYGIATWFWN